jgi:murein DD-endopeptidase MepM/ murein hydrolase activator NlpD
MLSEKLCLMFFTKGTGFKKISLNPTQFYKYSVAFILSVFLFVALAIYLSTDLFQNARIAMLENERDNLQKQLLINKEKIALLNGRMTEVEREGDILRNSVGLPAIDKDIRQVGVGGSFASNVLDYNYLDEVGRTSAEIKMDIDKLEREIHLEKNSLNEIDLKKNEQDMLASHMPTIRPILGAVPKENFGLRLDPFLGKIAMHEGVDIPMPIGTKVLAPGDGVVKVAKTIYTPHKSYGMEIVIDHGFGYETRYGHLSKILVRPGQTVKRWQPIGEVGDTGKSTGPHLHYEVLYSGKPENPMNFMLN